MAQYLILIFGDESAFGDTPAEWDAAMQAHGAFTQQVGEMGATILGGEALQPSSTATSIRGDGAGGQVVTDGPFAETKEALGGYYLVEAADLDQAIAVGRLCPAPEGGVEVRPILPTG